MVLLGDRVNSFVQLHEWLLLNVGAAFYSVASDVSDDLIQNIRLANPQLHQTERVLVEDYIS